MGYLCLSRQQNKGGDGQNRFAIIPAISRFIADRLDGYEPSPWSSIGQVNYSKPSGK